MPYSISNPPEKIKDMPKHAIEIWVNAFNAALKQYKDEGKANATAYAAVKTKYKQDEKGNWVARESEVSMGVNTMDDLQSKYSELIQEAGKRNASADATRIKKILELCKELLDKEPDEEETKEAIKEANECLEWLKLQEVMKTDDGEKFPAQAYAYVPDPEKPSEWRLRLWENPTLKVTRKQLGAASAALSPGGFRGQRVDIPKEDLPAVKRKIRAEYRKLDVEVDDMPKWVKEAEVREIIRESVEIPIEEVSIDNISKGILPVRFLQSGFNKGKHRFYTESAISDAVKVFDGIQMYANHQTESEERERPEGDIRDWVAVLENTKVSDKGNACGVARIHSPWFKEMVQGLYEQGTLDKLGTSIRGAGKGVKSNIEGTNTVVIEGIASGRSVDFVTLAGAGGVAGLVEAEILESERESENDIDVVTIEALKERRPDLVKLIETETKTITLKEVKMSEELQAKVTELEGQVETLTTERDEFKTKITEAEKAQRKAEAKSKVDEAVGKSELPEAAKARIVEKFKDSESADGVEDAIKAEKEYIEALKESGKPKNLGGSKPDKEKSKKELVESFKRLGMTEAQATEAAR